jgi:light-regulated signal transduction histidine kinase (bacteriophytochrome)
MKIFGRRNNTWRWSLRINGIGFEQEYAERIFNLFDRLRGRSSYEGTGVELAICRKIVENHSGIIKAQSRLGEGANFVVVLPAWEEKTKQPDK